MGGRDTSSGISYSDVGHLIRIIGGLHNGTVDFILSVPVREAGGVALDVRARFRRRSAGADGGYFERGVSGRWPSGASSTFAGLLFRLAHELDGKLTSEEEENERAKGRQGRMF